MLRFSHTSMTLASVVLILGCGSESDAPDSTGPTFATSDQAASRTVTKHVTQSTDPDYTWGIEQVLTAYLCANSAEQRSAFVIHSESDLVEFELGLTPSDFRIEPLDKSELYPNESLLVRVDVDRSPRTIYVVTRTESGYRVNLQATKKQRQIDRHEQFVTRYGLKKASLEVRIVQVVRNDRSAELDVVVQNTSKAHVAEFEIVVNAQLARTKTEVQGQLTGKDVPPGDSLNVRVNLDHVPDDELSCRFRIRQISIRTEDGQQRDVTEFFTVK